ncbi:MAG: hypothetical protein HKN32_01115, partial [Flavobacteriales bacterium]|nr:hypothetical protein [Flavobacteriales bacterium]
MMKLSTLSGILLCGLFSLTTFTSQSQCANEILLVVATTDAGDQTFWSITNDLNELIASGGPYANDSASDIVLCLEDGCYDFNMFSETGWNGGLATIIYADSILGLGFGNQPFDSFSFGVNAFGCGGDLPEGCTDQEACNFDPNAVVNDGSCVYPGCTDPEALNYDASAGCSDGSCQYEEPCSLNTITLTMLDTFGDGWNGATYMITQFGNAISEGTLVEGEFDVVELCLAD